MEATRNKSMSARVPMKILFEECKDYVNPGKKGVAGGNTNILDIIDYYLEKTETTAEEELRDVKKLRAAVSKGKEAISKAKEAYEIINELVG